MYTDENVLSSPLQYYTIEEEIESNQPRDMNPKKSIKPSKNRQKLWNTSDENDDNHKVISEKDQTVHINPQEVHHRMRTKGELLSKSEINNDDDDNDVYHRVPVNKVSAEQKHKVTLSSKYDATVHDDDDEDDNSDGGKEFHHETDRKPPAHKRKRVMRHTNSDFIEEQVKPDEFSHPKRRRHLKNVTSRRYRTPSHESSSEDIFFNTKYATGCQAYSREGCKCTCEQSHDRDIRIHCHPVHDIDTGRHFICHLNESSPLYSHHCKDVEDEDILDVLEQICADRRRLRRKRCCNDLSIGKQSNKIKSVDFKRYLSPKTIKLLKTVEKPSVFDNLPMTCLENELKRAISSRNKLHSTSDTENECYEYNKKHLSKSIPNYPIQRDTPSNIPNISQSVQQCQTNTFPNPNNIQTYCPTVLPVISPSRVLVRHIPVPVVIPQCLSTNQLIYPYSIPATQLVVQPNYFMPNTSQRFNYASPYSQYHDTFV
ncbi:unnamed protein product [Heterobilharzia americana]|nr:unnamed protein product [Heterobilharzia americana]